MNAITPPITGEDRPVLPGLEFVPGFGAPSRGREEELSRWVLARLRAMESARRPWIDLWQELCDFMLPRKNSFTGSGVRRGRSGDERIFDATAPHALEVLASSLGGLLTNPALPWFDIRVRRPEAAESGPVREFLRQARERMVRLFNTEATGFQTHVHELYLDVALLGAGVMYVEADPECVVRFCARPLGEVFLAENARGVVDTVFRRYELTARQAWQEWGEACSDAVRAKLADRPEDAVAIVHAVFPREDRDPAGLGVGHFPFASVYLEAESGRVLEESGYLEMPYMAPRWAKAAGEIYGRGPGLTALSDVRVLNAMARTALMAAEKMSDPPLMVPDDGFLGPVRTGPGGLSYYRAGSSDRIEPLPVAVDLRAAEEMMTQRRDSVRRIFLNDQLAPADSPALTATEALIRQSEKMRVLGPVLGRMQTEFLGPVIGRVFRILLRAGELPALPDELDPGEIEVRYVSPIALAQRQYEAQGLVQAMEYLKPFVGAGDGFGVLDNFDTDRIARHAAELFGAPGEYLRPDADVARLRAQRAELAAQAGPAAQAGA
ncbi:MAG: portal protein [Desulfovibrionaceae bacterium]